MSEPALFVFIREGEKRGFADRWAERALNGRFFSAPLR